MSTWKIYAVAKDDHAKRVLMYEGNTSTFDAIVSRLGLLPDDGCDDTFIDAEGGLWWVKAYTGGKETAPPPAQAPSSTVPPSWGSLSDTEVLQIAPVRGNFSQDEVEAFCAGFRRCARAARRS